MSDDTRKLPAFKRAPALFGESDDFVLPVAPPPAPSGHAPTSRRTGGTISETSSSTHAVDDGTPAVNEQQAVPAPAADEPTSDTPDQVGPLVTQNPGKSVHWSLVILLVPVLGLLLVIVNNSNETPRITPSVSSSGIDERELVSARSEAESMRDRVAQMQQRISELEQQQEAERKAAEARVDKLLREKKALEDRASNSSAEVDRLKRQVQSTAPKDPPRPAPAQAESVIPNNNTLYRVTGLIYGDTLNVRSGPGADNPIVIRLHNGVELSIVGAAVRNEADSWLPCLIDKEFTDPSTGFTKSLKQEGWVNSAFVEPAPP